MTESLSPSQQQEVKEILTSLGPHLATLKYLMNFLVKEVQVQSHLNKMTPTNLSIVFGPTLMRPEKETMETTLNSPLINHIVQRIIEVSPLFLFSRLFLTSSMQLSGDLLA